MTMPIAIAVLEKLETFDMAERANQNAAFQDDEECTDFKESIQTNILPNRNLEKCLLLCVPYACSIGGIGSVRTLPSTSPSKAHYK